MTQTYSNPAAQFESVVPVAAIRQLEEGKACKQPTHFGDWKSEKKKILLCRQTESEPAPGWYVKRRAAGRNRIRGNRVAAISFCVYLTYFWVSGLTKFASKTD